MKAIRSIERNELRQLISSAGAFNLSEDEKQTLTLCLSGSTSFWVGFIGEVPVCTWGLIPPTILSNEAYLWLYTTEAIRGHEFMFVRNSQIAVKQMLDLFPTIHGHVQASAEHSIRWLKWLGAELLPPQSLYIPFVIRK